MSSIAGRWAVVIAVLVVGLAGGLLVPAQAHADASSPPPGATRQVSFDDIVVAERTGALHVRYAIDRRDWESLAEDQIKLWIHLTLPTREDVPNQSYSYTLGIDERTGTLDFPRWLTPPKGDTVGLCVMGTGPGDNLGFGRGWLCQQTHWMDVRRRMPSGTDHPKTVTLVYHDGPPYIPYAPWTEPTIPDFPGPFDELPAP